MLPGLFVTARVFGLVCAVAAVAACGSGADDDGVLPGPDASGCEEAADGRYFPLVDGARWTYIVTDLRDGTKASKSQTVGAIEDVGGAKAGVQAHRVTTTKAGGTVVSWQEDTGTAVIRHRELDMAGGTQTDEIYTPHKLRMDDSAARTSLGATYHEDYEEIATDLSTSAMTTTTKGEDWIVEVVGELATVPAGDFCTIRIRRQATANGSPSSDKRYWFARGVGKVREESADRREELADVQIPAGAQ